jgi:hypothetical protein
MSEIPHRVVVTSPRTRTAKRHPNGVAPVSRGDEHAEFAQSSLRPLIRSQLRLSLTVCGVLVITVGGLPALFLLVPGVRELAVLGVPLPWVVLAGLIYPLFVGCAWWYVRRAERIEGEFIDRGGDR